MKNSETSFYTQIRLVCRLIIILFSNYKFSSGLIFALSSKLTTQLSYGTDSYFTIDICTMYICINPKLTGENITPEAIQVGIRSIKMVY